MDNDLKIPSNWKKVPLGEIVVSKKGKKPKVQQENEFKGSVPYLDIKAFEEKEIRKYADISSSVEIDENDLAIVWDGSRSGLVSKGMKGALGSTLAKIKSFVINPDYLYHFLCFQYSYINNNTKGTGIPHVNPEILWNIKIPMPPLEEQDRIILLVDELFSALEKGITSLKLAQSQLEVYLQSILERAFKGEISSEWRKNNDNLSAKRILENINEERIINYESKVKEWDSLVKKWEENGKISKKPLKPKHLRTVNNLVNIDSLSKIPDNWKWIKIGSFEDKICSGSTPKGGKGVYLDEGIPFIRSMNVYPYKIILKKIVFIDSKTNLLLRNSQIKENDVLLNITGASIGRCAFVPEGFGNANVNQHVCIIRTFSKDINYKFLCFYLNSPEAQKIIKSINSGATREALNLSQIRNFPFPLTSKEEQIEIVNIIESKLSVIENLERLIDSCILNSEALRYSILKKAFIGELTNQDLSNNSISELLANIKLEKEKYIEEEKQNKKTKSKKTKKMTKKLNIEEVLKASDSPMLAVDVWQQSIHKDNIEDFYTELKRIQKNIKEVKNGTESLLSIKL